MRKISEEKMLAERQRLEQMKEYEYTYAACHATVSYTHLDVYKRQVSSSQSLTATPGAAQRFPSAQ